MRRGAPLRGRTGYQLQPPLTDAAIGTFALAAGAGVLGAQACETPERLFPPSIVDTHGLPAIPPPVLVFLPDVHVGPN